MVNLLSICDVLIKAVQTTGDKMVRERGAGIYEYIPDDNMMKTAVHTEYDVTANRLLLEFLPELARAAGVGTLVVISEEIINPQRFDAGQNTFTSLDVQDNYDCLTLVIDPICGTIPYVRGVPDFVVTAALLDGLTPLMAVIYQPNTQELFHAIHQQGAYLNGKPLEAPSKTAELKWAYVSIEHKVFREAPAEDVQNIVNEIMRLRTAGTCALEMCYVACGRLDCLIKLKQPLYDYLAGAIIMQEAGMASALVMLDGETPLLPVKSLCESCSFLASNGPITKEIARYTRLWQCSQ